MTDKKKAIEPRGGSDAWSGGWGKNAIKRELLQLGFEGVFFARDNAKSLNNFLGSVDRFAEIIAAFQGRKRVIDVGSGGGVLIQALSHFGHECHALDLGEPDDSLRALYDKANIHYRVCNIEVDTYPWEDETFDAVSCCQVMEHISHSPLPPMREFLRILKPGGICEIDVPNVACFRNRSRLLRGKNITYDYKRHYIDAAPILYKEHSFYPMRHNREFTRNELQMLYEVAGFQNVKASFLKSRRYRTGWRKLYGPFTAIRDCVPSLRKSLIAYGFK